MVAVDDGTGGDIHPSCEVGAFLNASFNLGYDPLPHLRHKFGGEWTHFLDSDVQKYSNVSSAWYWGVIKKGERMTQRHGFVMWKPPGT